jgi:hemerythrin
LKVGLGSKILKFALENFLARFTKFFTDEENIMKENGYNKRTIKILDVEATKNKL